ncbi:hypothetical protein ASPZODRAFT_95610 [Penicilliopsis zonata CBS 506.65]|uniref:AB hydrolase-1 domain-containing protein n=1 Tax=Penicilliopsis zonata CBS 506.65 TaxID=1073090 RepID=A0A1L9SIT5_9EURO|nr:hypothetical protein ASPZODRAFT_95610 [Penicilliopsis zonata CBS 506.65]OJJ47011.1 hypothetical protein ASPZODRAFT_95610 [Penicilliopsis zonata CBS 506.65]
MAIDKINVSGDPRVQRQSAEINGKTYGYLLAQPESGNYSATVVLIHGFPDISMAWRYQIPLFLEMGLRVVAPDCIGYGQTDAPEDLSLYSQKNSADDIKALVHHLGESKIILGGHDWGAALVYRIALWHPEIIMSLFTVCVPFMPPSEKFIPLEDAVRTILPNFAYQLQFKDGDLESVIQTREDIKNFLSTLYGGRTDEGELAFAVEKGVLLDKMGRVNPSPLLSEEELEYYTNEFSRNGVRGPLNWYRTREINHNDELAILDRRITCPVLFIQAQRDSALPPHLGRGMAKTIPQAVVEQVDTSHWALWEKPQEVNEILASWLKGLLGQVKL